MDSDQDNAPLPPSSVRQSALQPTDAFGHRQQTQNVYLYTCDGYLELKNGVIIIEFDGVIYHDDEQDIRRDDDILYLDNSIVGILRIGQYYLKCGNINDNIKNIKDALQKIENSTETRIVLK